MLELGLRGTELNLFAIVYGFSQREDGCYYGTRAALAEMCGVSSKRTIDAAIDSLIKKGLLSKFQIRKGEEIKTALQVCANSAPGGCNNCTGGGANSARGEGANSAPMNNNIYINNIKNNPPFIPPTKEQVSDYAAERGFIDPEGFAAHFVDYYTQAQQSWHLANGRPMKDWKRAVITWEPGNKYRHFGPSQAQRPRYGSQQATAVDDLLAMGAELYGINTNYDEQ